VGKQVTVRVAVVQSGSLCFDTPATLQKMQERVGQAALAGGQLVVFPEAYVGGYPKGMDFGARVGSRSDTGRDWFAKYHDSAIDIDGPEIALMCDMAADHHIFLVSGIIERDGNTLYCTVVTISPKGKLINLHRKTMPTAMERLIWGFGDGSTLQVADTNIGRIGGAICWENYMPQLRLSQYAQGVELYCAPTVDDRDQWQHSMRHIAVEGRCFVLAACQYADRGNFPDRYPSDYQAGDVVIRGGSVIVSPMGEVLAGPVYDEEAILLADLDMDDIRRGKFDLDVVGHYARPDIFSLSVNTEQQVPAHAPADDYDDA